MILARAKIFYLWFLYSYFRKRCANQSYLSNKIQIKLSF